MFFTSGMDEKFKVWDTNALEVYIDKIHLSQSFLVFFLSTFDLTKGC